MDDAPCPLIVRQETPLHAEPPLGALVDSWITPVRRFFVRNHGPVPAVDPERYRLSVSGLVERPLSLSHRDLRDGLPRATATATIECAGNRRSEHSRTKKALGAPWGAGALGNAVWGGARLADVLARAGLGAADGARHVWLESLDECELAGRRVPFGGSIPIGKALEPDTLVAYEMNGEPLTPAHGFPARACVPGYIGARSVKWLGAIVVSDRPSENPFHARDYKVFPPDVGPESARWESAQPLGEVPLNSAICTPGSGATVPAGRLRVSGYALAAGAGGGGDDGRAVARVEASKDGGRTWTEAVLRPPPPPPEARFTWRLWDAELTVAPGTATLAVRATDSAGETQPETPDWNFKGYIYDGWHRVTVHVHAT